MKKQKILSWLKSRRVAVLRGGWSSERTISLKTGEAVLQSFRRLGVKPADIDVRPNVAQVLNKKKIQFCFNALHGPFGEDGRIQGLLDVLRIPYTGSDALASAVAMDKHLSKEIFVRAGVATPAGVTVLKSDFASKPAETYKKLHLLISKGPLFVKPIDQGSAIGVSRISKKSELTPALKKCFRLSKGALVERLIIGKELTVGILGKMPLPVTEIIAKHDFYDFYSKYSQGGSRHITPAPISKGAARRAQILALRAFQALGCTVYGRVDIMMKSEKEMFVLEINTIPGMTGTSLMPEAAAKAGIGFDDLVLKIVELSLKARGGRF